MLCKNEKKSKSRVVNSDTFTNFLICQYLSFSFRPEYKLFQDENLQKHRTCHCQDQGFSPEFAETEISDLKKIQNQATCSP